MKNIYILQGNYYKRKRVLDDIKNSLGSFDLFVCDNSYNYDYIQQKITEYSCFDRKNLVILNEWPSINISGDGTFKSKKEKEKAEKKKVVKEFKKIISSISPDCVLVFNNLESMPKSLIVIVEKIGEVKSEDQFIPKKNISKLAKRYFLSKGKSILDEDVEFLVESISINKPQVDFDVFHLLLKKIDHYIGNRKKISKEDIFSICSQDSEFIIWSLFSALDKKRINECFSLLNIIVSMAKDAESDFDFIVNMLVWRFKLLLIVKECEEKNMEVKEICNELLKLKKIKRVSSRGSQTAGGFGFKIRMEEVEDKPVYSVKMVENLFKWGTNKCYDLNELFFINYCLGKIVEKIRLSDSISGLIMLQVICVVICGKLRKASDLGIFNTKELLFV
jgi:DNA polymerase III delta subunit